MLNATKREDESLLEELRRLVQLANQSFVDDDDFHFEGEVANLPDVVSRLQKFIGKPFDRTPFWNCVKAVDHHWTRLKLVKTLDRMVKRATDIPPAPLTQLLRLRSSFAAGSWQKAFIDKWEADSNKTFETLPSDPVACWQILGPLVSPEFKQFQEGMSRGIIGALRPQGDKSVEAFLGLAAFHDFQWQRVKWRERYWAGHEDLNLFVSVVENEEYEEMRAKVLESEGQFSAVARARALTKERVKKARKKRSAVNKTD